MLSPHPTGLPPNHGAVRHTRRLVAPPLPGSSRRPRMPDGPAWPPSGGVINPPDPRAGGRLATVGVWLRSRSERRSCRGRWPGMVAIAHPRVRAKATGCVSRLRVRRALLGASRPRGWSTFGSVPTPTVWPDWGSALLAPTIQPGRAASAGPRPACTRAHRPALPTGRWRPRARHRRTSGGFPHPSTGIPPAAGATSHGFSSPALHLTAP